MTMRSVPIPVVPAGTSNADAFADRRAGAPARDLPGPRVPAEQAYGKTTTFLAKFRE